MASRSDQTRPAAPDTARRRPRTPLVTVDGVVLWGEEPAGPPARVLLVQRRHPPFQGAWVLPGGFVEIGEDLPDAVAREIAEETGLTGLEWRQHGAYGRPDRDPRGHTVSVVFVARIAAPEPPAVQGGDDAAAACWWPLDDLPALGFDHARILADVLGERRYRGDPDRLRSPDRLAVLEPDRVADLCLQGLAPPPQSLLDVGTGTGLFAQVFGGRGLHVVGVDVAPDMVRRATAAVPGARFVAAAGEALPLRDGSVDLAFLGVVLHEATDHGAMLREVRRVARRRAAVLEWPHREEPHGPPLDHRLPEQVVRRLAADAGFRRCEVVPLTRLLLYLLTP